MCRNAHVKISHKNSLPSVPFYFLLEMSSSCATIRVALLSKAMLHLTDFLRSLPNGKMQRHATFSRRRMRKL